MIGGDDARDRLAEERAGLLALVLAVGVQDDDHRRPCRRQVDGQDLVSGDRAVVADPALDVEDAQSVAGTRNVHRGGLQALGLGRRLQQRAGGEGAGPAAEVLEVGDHLSGGPAPGGIPVGRVHGLARGRLVGVPVRVGHRQGRARREDRAAEPGRSQDVLGDDLVERPAGDLLHHQAEQDQVGVAVVELRARLELYGVLEGVVEQLPR